MSGMMKENQILCLSRLTNGAYIYRKLDPSLFSCGDLKFVAFAFLILSYWNLKVNRQFEVTKTYVVTPKKKN